MSRLSKAINSKNGKTRRTKKQSFISKIYKDDFEKIALELGYYLVSFVECEDGFIISGIPIYRIAEIKRRLRGETEKNFDKKQMEFRLFNISG